MTSISKKRIGGGKIYFYFTWSMPGRGKSGLGRKGGEKAMAGGWQAAGLLVSMVGTQGDIESRPPHHGEPFLYSHPHTPQHCWCNASRPPLQVISRKTSNCGTRLKTWLAAWREAGGGDGRPQCEGRRRGGREVGKRGAGSRLGWQASYTAGASSAARAVARGARRCRPCGASTTLLLPAWTGPASLHSS